MYTQFPFTAIYGQDEFKLALLLSVIDPGIGGVLIMGDKGTAKTTAVRGLSDLMQQHTLFPFVNLPIGATEDRVLGSVKLDVLINNKRLEIQEGLLSLAHKGILYIDEVNLLNDYLVDILLDAASSGSYHLEREGISGRINSIFSLIGTMNPEEGELRPQLLDRFGLCVAVETPTDKNIRMEIVNRRLAFDSNPSAFSEQYQQQQQQLFLTIDAARNRLTDIIIPAEIRNEVAQRCITEQTEGLRADILLLKTARAYTAFQERKQVTQQDIAAIAHFVLKHRSKKNTSNPNSHHKGSQSPREEKEEHTKSRAMH